VAGLMRDRSALLRHRDFLLLWSGQTVSEVGSQVTVLADFSLAGARPVFLTVTRTVGQDYRQRHTDVSLWYVISGSPELRVVLDPREFTGGRWWTAAEIQSASPDLFDPHLGRFVAKVRSRLFTSPAPEARAET
jgi:8-oxo-dGTP diphosphatase